MKKIQNGVWEKDNFRVIKRSNTKWAVTEVSDHGTIIRHIAYKQKSYAFMFVQIMIETKSKSQAIVQVAQFANDKHVKNFTKKFNVEYAEDYKNALADKKQSNFPNEKNDCTVLAVSLLTGMDYETSLLRMKKFGRKHNKGTYNQITHSAIKSAGFVFENYTSKYGQVSIKDYTYEIQSIISPDHKNQISVTSNQIVKNADKLKDVLKGKFIVYIKRHAFVIIDGVIQDHKPLGSAAIHKIYKIAE